MLNMTKTKVIVSHPEKGIFVGVMGGYAIFSETDTSGSFYVYGFETLEKAQKFFNENVPSMKDSVAYNPIKSTSEYVSVVDIIKSKVPDVNTTQLFLNLPCENEFLC